MPLSEKELQQIKDEAEKVYPETFESHSGVMLDDNYHLIKRGAYIAGATKEREKTKEVLESVKRIIDWSRKYPAGKIYPYHEAAGIENELTDVIDGVSEALTNYQNSTP